MQKLEKVQISESEEVGSLSIGSVDDAYPYPSDEELAKLRRIRDKVNLGPFLIAACEFAERFTFYGLNAVIQNYIQLPRENDRQTGGLGLGQSKATALSNFFKFWCYATPLAGAAIADLWLGKYRTIVAFSCLYVVGIMILFVTSLPQYMDTAGEGGLIAFMVVVGLAAGGIKPNVSTLVIEQYKNTKLYVKTLRSGERVIVDPAITVRYIFSVFYICICSGSLSSIATPELEKYVDFWAAYLLPFAMFPVAIITVLSGHKIYVNREPKAGILKDTFSIVNLAIKKGLSHDNSRCKNLNVFDASESCESENTTYALRFRQWRKRFKAKFSLDIARPSVRASQGLSDVPWTDLFVDEVARAIDGCKILLFFPIFWVAYDQGTSNLISQAGQMETHAIPNDIMQNIEPIAVIILIPLMNQFGFPLLRKLGFPMLPITRVSIGFFFCSLTMVYSAIIQKIIYSRGPCYKFPSDSRCSLGPAVPNHIHVAIQTPGYLLLAFADLMGALGGYIITFDHSPASMKSIVMSLFLLTNAGGAIIGIALSTVSKNPDILWLYAGLGVSIFIVAILFWMIFKGYDKRELQYMELNDNVAKEERMNSGVIDS